MSLVADYGSSSDDDSSPISANPLVKGQVTLNSSGSAAKVAPNVRIPAEPSKVTVTSSSVLTNASLPQKRKKKINFLPEEIQEALQRGRYDTDSDSDGESQARKQKRVSGGQSASELSALLGMLPEPKRQPKGVRLSLSTSVSAVKPKAKAGMSTTNDPTVQEPPSYEAINKQVSSGDNAAAHYAGDAAQYYENYDTSATQYYGDPDQTHSSVEYSAMDDLSTRKVTGKSARKREQMFEQQLLQGNVEGVEVKEIVGLAGEKGWRPNDATAAQLASEKVQVTAQFWNSKTGTTSVAFKPTRAQRQKHQLNQLLFDAKSREFELMERRGQALRTKAQTQAKYGW